MVPKKTRHSAGTVKKEFSREVESESMPEHNDNCLNSSC